MRLPARRARVAAALVALAVLAACGGGGGGTADTPPVAGGGNPTPLEPGDQSNAAGLQRGAVDCFLGLTIGDIGDQEREARSR